MKIAYWIMLLICQTCWANTAILATKNQSLQAIDQQIKSLEQTLSQKKNHRQTLTQTLKNSDLAIARLHRQSQLRQQLLEEQQTVLDQLQTQHTQQNQQATQYQQTLKHELIQAYRLGRQPLLQQLLGQEDSRGLSQMMTYYSYLTADRQQKIKTIKACLNDYAQTKTTIETKTQKLSELQEKLAQQRQELTAQQQLHKTILQKVNHQITDQAGKLNELRENKVALAKIISQLKQAARKNVATLTTQLPWPVVGQLENLYGQQIEKSELKHQGILIRAPNGTPVKTVSAGKVVFADWLRGFGLLIIIDHGNNYLSLYGRNQQLTKQLGDTVALGEPIAAVGHSGGADEDGLYFELRHHGKPINPSEWLRKPQV